MKLHLYLHACRIALITFLIGAGIDFLSSLNSATSYETSLGLDNLFKLRGSLTPPENIVVIAMDEASENKLGVGEDLRRWREYHARLIRELHRQGVRLIVFDLQFLSPNPQVDPDLATAMHDAGNVLLTDCVQKFRRGDQDFYGREGCADQNKLPVVSKIGNNQEPLAEELVVARKIAALPVFSSVALDHSPFILANDAEHAIIHEAWLYYDILADAPSLPLLAWLYTLQLNGELVAKVGLEAPYSEHFAEFRRGCFQKQSNEKAEMEKRMMALLCDSDSRYLNFYGPPRTIRTESYSDIYERKVTDLKNKIVFIGKASRLYAPSNLDIFQTPLTTNQSGKMWGLEIMATQFANLAEGRFIESPLPPAIPLLLYGFLLNLLLYRFAGKSGIAAGLCFSVGYFGLAFWCFSRFDWWLPVAVPLSIQLPLSLLISLWDLLKKWRPASTVEKNVYGVCLATDIAEYSTISEQHKSEHITRLLNDYNKMISHPIHDRAGRMNPYIGDSMMAYWVDLPTHKQRASACLTALEILQAVEIFNKTSSVILPIRIGIFEGDFTLSTSDAGDVSIYRAVGDPLNIASRIEGVNKKLGTRILAAKINTVNVNDIFFRPVGKFSVVGRKEPLELMEIVGLTKDLTDKETRMYQQFELGLNAFQEANWQKAAQIFKNLKASFGADGPSEFYLTLATEYAMHPPPVWNGYVALNSK